MKFFTLPLLISICQICSTAKAQDIKPIKPLPTNINLSILLDLSARIRPTATGTPQQKDNDIECLEIICNALTQHTQNKHLPTINESIKTYIVPIPGNNKIQQILKKCNQELNQTNINYKNAPNLTKTYINEMEGIYDIAMKQSTYFGSDLWGFFKNNAPHIIRAEKRNILVILTDGYIYHKNHIRQNKSQYSYLTPKLIENHNIDSTDFKSRITNTNFGLIPATPYNLSYLEVLIIGIDEGQQPPSYKDILAYTLSKWLEQMGVKHYKITPNNDPKSIKNQLEKFILADN